MDSKYATINEENNKKINGHKRKGLIYHNTTLKVKRLHIPEKIKNEDIKVPKQEEIGSSNSLSVNKHKVINNKPEDLQEARKRLPVYSVRGRIIEEIKKHNTLIIIGETGSGKTTQIPQLIHGARLEGQGTIAITQPRRVAAITIAMRVAAEMNTSIGDIVGYSVRFEDVTSYKTRVKYLTDGMLLRESVLDPLLNDYTVIILDEAHERTVSTDVLFGIVKIAQLERAERKLTPLKLIIMSATMDVDTFSHYFNRCPVIYLEGRTFPVTIFHSKTPHEDYQYAAVCTIFQLHATAPPNHDFLVFLTGQEEIETVMYNIKQIAVEAKGPAIKVCPLYAGLPAAKQLQVWKELPPGTRKIVLATNIAEASVTIPRIKYVIDSGMVKERQWCSVTGAERLRVMRCAAAAAWQRAGRAGRDAPGCAYRLYTAADLAARPAHQPPEILRCPLAPALLSLVALGADPLAFPLMSAPPEDSIKAALLALKELGAIDSEVNPKLTNTGKKMAAFPIDPKYSKVLLCAVEFNCLDEMLSLVAVLSSESVFHCPLNKREEALRVKQKFTSPLGDHITLLNVFKAFGKAPLKKQWCKENFLHHRNLVYATEVRRQLLNICQKFNMTVSSCGNDDEQVLQCLARGLRGQTARRRGGGYVTAGGAAAALHPSSALAARPPPALLFGQLLHTTRLFLHTASELRADWLLH